MVWPREEEWAGDLGVAGAWRTWGGVGGARAQQRQPKNLHCWQGHCCCCLDNECIVEEQEWKQETS